MFSGLANLFFGQKTVNIDPEPRTENPIKETDNNTNLPLSREIHEEIDDDDWLLIETEPEGEEDDSLPRSGSEDELPFVQIRRPSSTVYFNSINNNSTCHRQRSQAHHLRLGLGSNSVSTVNSSSKSLSPLRDGNHNTGITQSLYVVSQLPGTSGNIFNMPASVSMEESWFLTPPPCFTSTGPINMESSPFENLLIEHPSMSVYRSIRSAQEATESFVNLDLGVAEESQSLRRQPILERISIAASQKRPSANRLRRLSKFVSATPVAPQPRPPKSVQRLSKEQIKQEVLFHNSQKVHEKKDRESKCRGAMKRGNKARDVNGKGNNCPRRSDMQHCKIISGANNNRKC